MSKDYYKILGVERNASQDDIKKAFRKKAHEYHPDKSGGDEDKFKEINEAYQVLGDKEKRSKYDQFGSAFEHAQAGGGFQGFDGFRDFSGFANGFSQNGQSWNFESEDLGDIFGGFGDLFGFGRSSRRRTKRGSDIQTILTIEFNEAIGGAEKEVSLRRTVKCDRCQGLGVEPGSKIETCKACDGRGRVTRLQRTILGNMQIQTTCENCGGEGKTYSQKCTDCGGTGIKTKTVNLKIKIPAGINDGETIRLTGQGEAGEKGAITGDLYINIRVKPHTKFVREGNDIKSKVTISFTQAALGDKIEMETVDGPVSLKIPEGTQTGTVFKLKGKGVYRLHSHGPFGGAQGKRGDQFVEVTVKTPTNLDRRQKEALKQLGL